MRGWCRRVVSSACSGAPMQGRPPVMRAAVWVACGLAPGDRQRPHACVCMRAGGTWDAVTAAGCGQQTVRGASQRPPHRSHASAGWPAEGRTRTTAPAPVSPPPALPSLGGAMPPPGAPALAHASVPCPCGRMSITRSVSVSSLYASCRGTGGELWPRPLGCGLFSHVLHGDHGAPCPSDQPA